MTETPDEHLARVRRERSGFRFDTTAGQMSPERYAASIDLSEFDADTRDGLTRILKSGDLMLFAVAVGQARIAAAERDKSVR